MNSEDESELGLWVSLAGKEVIRNGRKRLKNWKWEIDR